MPAQNIPAVPPRPDSPKDSRPLTSPPRAGDVLSIDLDLLDENPFQPRTEIDPTKLDELITSLKQTGLIQPIAVVPNGPGRYHIVAGHRRAAAFKSIRCTEWWLRVSDRTDTAGRWRARTPG